MKEFYFKTFLKVALIPYVGGAVLHVLRLIYDFPLSYIPYEVDYLVTFLAGYSGVGLIVFAKRIPFINMLDKILYGFVVFHLTGSAILHGYTIIVQNHDFFKIFSYNYSYFAVLYFVIFGVYCFLLRRRLEE